MNNGDIYYIDVYHKSEADKRYFKSNRAKYSVLDILLNRKRFLKDPHIEMRMGMLREITLAYITLFPEKSENLKLTTYDNETARCVSIQEYANDYNFTKEDAEKVSVDYYEWYHIMRSAGKAFDNIADFFKITDDFEIDAKHHIQKTINEKYGAMDTESYNMIRYGDITNVNKVMQDDSYYIVAYYNECDILDNKIKDREERVEKIEDEPSVIKRYRLMLKVCENNIAVLNSVKEEVVSLSEDGVEIIESNDVIFYKSSVKGIKHEQYVKAIMKIEEERKEKIKEYRDWLTLE